jgi:hypothetical protein
MNWVKAYKILTNPRALALSVTTTNVIVLGQTSYTAFGLSLKRTTGEQQAITMWVPLDGDPYYNFFHASSGTVLNNGNLVIFGQANAQQHSTPTFPLRHTIIFEVTANLQFVRCLGLYSNRRSELGHSRITVFPDGSAAFTRAYYSGSWTANILFGKMVNGQVVRERSIKYSKQAIQQVSNFEPSAAGTHYVTQRLGDSATRLTQIELLRFRDSDTSGSCTGVDTSVTTVSEQPFVTFPITPDAIESDIFYETGNASPDLYRDGWNVSDKCEGTLSQKPLDLGPDTTLCNTSLVLRAGSGFASYKWQKRLHRLGFDSYPTGYLSCRSHPRLQRGNHYRYYGSYRSYSDSTWQRYELLPGKGIDIGCRVGPFFVPVEHRRGYSSLIGENGWYIFSHWRNGSGL